MMKNKKYTRVALALLLIVFIGACRKETLDTSSIPFLGGDTYAANGEIDKWIHDSLTVPYNIQVKYKFDKSEASSISATLVPVKEEIVLPALKDIKTVWINTYEAEAGSTFMKTYVVKLINLIGSPSYNINGSITLGEAEGGLKINLYDMNRYDPQNNYGLFQQKMHTIHHEFGHILQQNKYYSPVFQTICVGDYTGNWTLSTMEEANSLGFVTPYARSAPDEDFVETIATMLVEGKGYFEGIKAKEIADGNQAAADKLTQKEQIIVAYYKDKWGIDFYELQKRVRLAMESVVPPRPLAEQVGYGKSYQGLLFDPIDKQASAGFATAYNEAEGLMEATGRSVQTVRISFFASDSAVLSVGYLSGSTVFTANYKFPLTRDADGRLIFGDVNIYNDGSGTQANGVSRQAQLAPLFNYFDGKAFVPKYYPDDPQTIDSDPNAAAFYLSADNTSFVSGALETSINYVH